MSCHSALLDRGSSTAHEQAARQPLPWQATSPPAQCTLIVFMIFPLILKLYSQIWTNLADNFLAFWDGQDVMLPMTAHLPNAQCIMFS